MSYSRTWDEQRFSPLKQINADNAGKLGLAWYADLNTYRGVQATPLFIDGVLYNVSVWNVVTAYDAHNGKVLWTYDPKVAPEWARLACCGPSARGIAAWKGKIYIGALDGRLIAIDAGTGKEVWSVQTFDHKDAYSITGPPRVFDGTVVIGNGGADYGVRGFVTAYDAETGKKKWKFYHGARRSVEGPGWRSLRHRDADGRENVDRRVVEDGRRRHGVGLVRLRPQAAPRVSRHGQRRSARSALPQTRAAATTCSCARSSR